MPTFKWAIIRTDTTPDQISAETPEFAISAAGIDKITNVWGSADNLIAQALIWARDRTLEVRKQQIESAHRVATSTEQATEEAAFTGEWVEPGP